MRALLTSGARATAAPRSEVRAPGHLRTPMGASCGRELRPLSCLILVLGAFIAALGVRPARTAEPPSAQDLVWVTEDRYYLAWNEARGGWYPSNKPGCDAISVHSTASGEVVAAGEMRASPGRMALAPDLSLAIATHTNTERMIHALYRVGDDLGRWRSGVLVSPAGPTSFGGVAFSTDGQFLLLATSNGYDRDPLGGIVLQNLPPHYVRKYPRPTSVSDSARLGGDVGKFETRGAAAEILVAPGGSTANVLTDQSVVHAIDIGSMQEAAEPIGLPSIESRACRHLLSPIGYMQAALSIDGHYLAANRGMVPELAVADLRQRTAITVPVAADVGFIGGLAVNHAPLNHGLLAVHAETSVLLYAWDPPAAPTELAREPIRSENLWNTVACGQGPHLSIAWSGDGQFLIASQDVGASEFAVLRVTREGERYDISRVHDLVACMGNPNGPNDIVTVNGLLAPPPTPTPAPSNTPTPTPASPTSTVTPSATARPTVTATPHPTSSATPTASGTVVRYAAYLPVTVRERCAPEHKRADVALVIDTSSSMNGQKLEDAKSAAAAFVGQMDLAPGRDQVAVVRYDTEAEVGCRLTNGRAVIEAAIRNLTSRSGTHIDKGLRLALAELQSARHNERNLPVIVLLTDGIQTGTPGQELSAAAEVRAAGVRLYTIGLGADVDAATLREMAGDARRYHFAPDSADLARIYSEIASDILCPAPAGGFWPGRSLGKLSRTGPPSGHGPPARRRSIGPGAGRDPRDGAALLDFAPLATGTAMGADPQSPADWVFVSDDDANPDYPGCDAHSVIDGRSGEVLVRGGYFVSPGRLTATSDGAKVISVCSNNGQFVYVLRRQDDAWREATTDKIEANVLQGSRCAVTPDDRGFLVSMGLYPGRSDLERYEMAGMSKVGLGQRTARRRDISAAEIVFGRDPNVAVVLDSVGLVHFLDTRTLQGVREPIEYERPSGTARNSFRNTNAAVSPDGRFLVVNTGNRAVITVIDLDTGLPTLVELPGLHETWDLEFNFALQNHGLLAVHGRTQVAVYRFAGAVPPALVAATAVVGQVPGDYGQAAADYFRGNSIAWTASGDGVIAAVRATREYRVWRLEASAPVPELRPSFDFDGCTGPGQFLQNDVLTLNRRAYATPTATSTPCPTPSPTEPATPTPPPTSMPTPEVTPSTTAAASRTATATRSITAVPAPRPAFLPIGLRERCDPLHKRADVALVVDTSSSMAGTKLEDAKLAAAAFVGQMDLEPGRDQVAVVRYDAEAEVVCRLTRARAVIEDAIRRLTSRSGTHIDAGLRTALAELQSPRHLERNLPVIVLLTDGVQTGTPGEELRAAEEVRDAGVRLYTIGLGADVDAAALVRMAGDDRRYHFAPDSAALAGIYAEIASDILCPAPTGGFWPGR